ncbi:similar to E3 ubiquitin protein ligase Itch [Cyanidioschyzon merolae strain 10D]|jgi:hypothetical protein|uniref:Similar to E3 ubiquitin protein ligase Itch n=1 Tax=Cyanidioschyzon merolae (strain NIES-3377 / 10D) TaxID=280699 RepID=M1UPQ8_CYAM1|nr:similar to E3 ubiquitin protein ligase Itch [Cyanidioschyzon merolae strain 10D]BAM79431.1 similar to E3 ubiquitin protein ligase Itch [Cyanidioschyzon merolae strain 10D]|eukprot:XP_005535717.1 similar to E3 ubiquitin protein ligase Itch [Cyanidioschyzon merolae strain 10D]
MTGFLHSAKLFFLSSSQRAGLEKGEFSEVQAEWEAKLRRTMRHAERLEEGLTQVTPAWKSVIKSVRTTTRNAKVKVAKGTGRRKQVVEDSFHDVDPGYLEFVQLSEEALSALESLCGRELFTGGTTLSHMLSEVRQYIEGCRTLITYIGQDVENARLEFDHYYNKCEALSQRARQRRLTEAESERMIRNRVKLERARDRYVARKRNYVDSARAMYYKYPPLCRAVLAALWSYQMRASEAFQEVSEMVEQHVSNNIELAKTIDVQSMAPAIAEEDKEVKHDDPEIPLTSYEAATKFEKNVSEVPLPPGWEERIDPATGRIFYISHAEKKTSWVPPTPPKYEKALKAPKPHIEKMTPESVRV